MKKKSWIHKLILGMLYLLVIVLAILGVYYYLEENDIDVEKEVKEFIADFEMKEPQKKIQNITSNAITDPLDQIEDTSLENKKNKKEFFKAQLEPEAKKIYEAFEENEEQIKTGNYEIDFGKSFTNLLNTETGEEKLKTYYQSAIEAYQYDHPEIFYLNFSKMYLNIETTTRGNKRTHRVFINAGENKNYLINEFQDKNQIEEAQKKIQEVKQNLMKHKSEDSFETIKMIHDYLVDTISYEQTVSKPNIYNIYGALVQKESVCEGYAKAFQYLVNEFEIPCVLVTGKGVNEEGKEENHAWNYVAIDNKWYAIDVTWDDPILEGEGILSKKSKYQYFLKGETTFKKDHIAHGKLTKNGMTYSYPILEKEDY